MAGGSVVATEDLTAAAGVGGHVQKMKLLSGTKGDATAISGNPDGSLNTALQQDTKDQLDKIIDLLSRLVGTADTAEADAEFAGGGQLNVTSLTKGSQPEANSMPVAMAQEEVADLFVIGPVMPATTAVGYDLLTGKLGGYIDCTRYRSIYLSFNCTFGGGPNFVFEGSNDGLIWLSHGMWAQFLSGGATVGVVISWGASSPFQSSFSTNLGFKYFRVRVQAAGTSGTLQLSARLSLQCQIPAFMNVMSNSNLTTNISQVSAFSVIQGGIGGSLGIGGNQANAAAILGNPLLMGGADPSGLLRRVITDANGRQYVVGTGYGTLQPSGQNALEVVNRDIDGDMTMADLFRQILREQQISNHLLFNLSNLLNSGGSESDAPDQIRRDESFFNLNS